MESQATGYKHKFPEYEVLLHLAHFTKKNGKGTVFSKDSLNYKETREKLHIWFSEHKELLAHSPVMQEMMYHITQLDNIALGEFDPEEEILSENDLSKLKTSALSIFADYINQKVINVLSLSELCKKIESKKNYAITAEDLLNDNGLQHVFEYLIIHLLRDYQISEILSNKLTHNESPLHNPEKFRELLPLLEHIDPDCFIAVLGVQTIEGKMPIEDPKIVQMALPLIEKYSEDNTFCNRLLNSGLISHAPQLLNYTIHPHNSQKEIDDKIIREIVINQPTFIFETGKISQILPALNKLSSKGFSELMKFHRNGNTPLHLPDVARVLMPIVRKHNMDLSKVKNANGVSVSEALDSGIADIIAYSEKIAKDLGDKTSKTVLKGLIETLKSEENLAKLKDDSALLTLNFLGRPLHQTLIETVEGRDFLVKHLKSKRLAEVLYYLTIQDKHAFEFDAFRSELFKALKPNDLFKLASKFIVSSDRLMLMIFEEKLAPHLHVLSSEQISQLFLLNSPPFIKNLFIPTESIPNTLKLLEGADFPQIFSYLTLLWGNLCFEAISETVLHFFLPFVKNNPNALEALCHVKINGKTLIEMHQKDLLPYLSTLPPDLMIKLLKSLTDLFTPQWETQFVVLLRSLAPSILSFTEDQILELFSIQDANGILCLFKPNSDTASIAVQLIAKVSIETLNKIFLTQDRRGGTPIFNPPLKMIIPFLEKLSREDFLNLITQRNKVGNTCIHLPSVLEALLPLIEKHHIDLSTIKNSYGLSVDEIKNSKFHDLIVSNDLIEMADYQRVNESFKNIVSEAAKLPLNSKFLSIYVNGAILGALVLSSDNEIKGNLSSKDLLNLLTLPDLDENDNECLLIESSTSIEAVLQKVLPLLEPEDITKLYNTKNGTGHLLKSSLYSLQPVLSELSDLQLKALLSALLSNNLNREYDLEHHELSNILIIYLRGSNKQEIFHSILENIIGTIHSPLEFAAIQNNIANYSPEIMLKLYQFKNSKGQTILHLPLQNPALVSFPNLGGQQIKSILSIQDNEGNTPLHSLHLQNALKTKLYWLGIDLGWMENNDGISVNDVATLQLSDTWLTTPKESDDNYPILTKEEYSKKVRDLNKRVLSLWDSLTFKDELHLEGLSSELLNIHGKLRTKEEVRKALEKMIGYMIKEKAWQGTPNKNDKDELHKFYCKMLGNFTDLVEQLEAKNDPQEAAGYLTGVATVRFEGRCATAYRAEIRQKRQLSQGKNKDINALVNDNANKALQTLLEKIVARDYESNSHTMIDFLYAVGLTDTPDALPSVNVENAQLQVKADWDLRDFIKEFSEEIEDFAVDWLKGQTPDDFSPKHIQLRDELMSEEIELLEKANQKLEKAFPEMTKENRQKINEFVRTFYDPFLYNLDFKNKESALKEILLEAPKGHELLSLIPTISLNDIKEFNQKVKDHFTILREELLQQTVQMVYTSPEALSNAEKMAVRRKYIGSSNEEILRQFSSAELLACLPMKDKMDYSNKVRELNKTEMQIINQTKTVLTFSQLVENAGLDASTIPQLIKIKKKLDQGLQQIGERLEDTIGIPYYAYTYLLPSQAVENERRLLPHKEHLEKKGHTAKHMLSLMGVIET